MSLFSVFRRPAAPVAAEARVLAARLPELRLEADRIAATILTGTHGRRRPGQGDSFWQYRPYVTGDSVHRIDWRQSARRDAAPVVRETERETTQIVGFWCDGSASMDWASRPDLPTKRDRAMLLALAAMLLLQRGGERPVSLSTPQRLQGVGVADLSTDLATAAAISVTGELPRHATLVLIGDFLAPIEETVRALRYFQGREIAGSLVQIADPAEIDFPFAGHIRFEGHKGEAAILTPRAQSLREAYVERRRIHDAALAEAAARAGWRLSRHRTDETARSGLLALWSALSGKG